MTLIAMLRDEHRQLCARLDQLLQLGIASDEGRALLHKTGQLLLAHLELEDSRLYPALRTHPATRTLARRYADEMAQLTPAVVAFFDSYREGGADPLGFTRSLGQLRAVLQQRIQREEGRLYPAYEAHCANAG